MLKMVDGTGIIGVDMVCPLGGTVSPPQPPNYDKVEVEGVRSLMLPNSLKAPLERLELIGNSVQGENPAPDNPQEIKSAGRFDEASGKYLLDVKVTGKNLLSNKPTDWMIGKTTSWGAVPQTPVSYGPNVKNAIATINVKSSTNYSFINKETNKLWVRRIIELDANGLGLVNHALYVNESLNYKKYNFSTRSNTANIVFEIKKVDNTELLSTDIESNKIMLVEGEANERTPYEPYTEQTLTLTSDRPITKWDRLVEQGGQYGWLYKHRIVNDLSALVKDSEPIYGKDGEKYFSVSLQGALFNYDYNKIYSVAGLCPKDSKIHYVPKPMIQSVVIYVSDTDTIMTAKEHMHYKVIYETTESQFAPLSESEQTQLRNLHSYNGTTHVFVDSGEVPCGIKLTYRKEI